MSLTRRMRLLALPVIAAVSLGACGPGAGDAVVVGPVTTPESRLVGTWSRLIVFTTGDQAHASETVWMFRDDGSFVRDLHTTNLTYGYFDTIRRTGRWVITAGSLEITYTDVTPPEQGRFNLEFVGRELLILDSWEYQRIR